MGILKAVVILVLSITIANVLLKQQEKLKGYFLFDMIDHLFSSYLVDFKDDKNKPYLVGIIMVFIMSLW